MEHNKNILYTKYPILGKLAAIVMAVIAIVAAGVLIHSISPIGHGFSTESISHPVTLPAVGVAYNPEGLNRHFVLEVLYINGMNNTVGWRTNYIMADKEDIKLEYEVKIGIGYSFNF